MERSSAGPANDPRTPHHGRNTRARSTELDELTVQERKSVTHGDFWIPESERETYKRALRTLNAAGIPYVVAGAYAVYEHTGIYRETKDLDLFVEPAHVPACMQALREAGFRSRLEQAHWLAKALDGEHFVDIIFGMGNGLAQIDHGWYQHSRPAILAATQVRVAPPEELIWHRLFIGERHRHDSADIVHLIACLADSLDWQRLLDRTGEHWPLLLAQLQIASYVYPELRIVPNWVLETLLERARRELRRARTGERVTRGTLVSRFSFNVDVHQWRFRDVRTEHVARAERRKLIRELACSDMWDERSTWVLRYVARIRKVRKAATTRKRRPASSAGS